MYLPLKQLQFPVFYPSYPLPWRCLYGRHLKQDRRYTYNLTMKRLRVTNCCSEKAIIITYSVCMCRISYSACHTHAPFSVDISGPSNSTRFFQIISQAACISKNLYLAQNVCFDFLLSERVLIHRITERDMIKNMYWSSCKEVLFRIRF